MMGIYRSPVSRWPSCPCGCCGILREEPHFSFYFTQCPRFGECLLPIKRAHAAKLFLLLDLGPESELDEEGLSLLGYL